MQCRQVSVVSQHTSSVHALGRRRQRQSPAAVSQLASGAGMHARGRQRCPAARATSRQPSPTRLPILSTEVGFMKDVLESQVGCLNVYAKALLGYMFCAGSIATHWWLSCGICMRAQEFLDESAMPADSEGMETGADLTASELVSRSSVSSADSVSEAALNSMVSALVTERVCCVAGGRA